MTIIPTSGSYTNKRNLEILQVGIKFTMPGKNKPQTNGFWLFAQSSKAHWRAQGLKVDSNNELLAIANPLWKNLDPATKKAWDQRAKEERKQKNNTGGEITGLDNVGNVIATRKNPAEEARKRREREIYSVVSKWHGKDVTQERFYLIDFQDMCELTDSDNTVEREWLPREVAIMEYCLREGMIQHYHQFIWPGEIPVGFRYCAEKVSQDVHHIPIQRFEEDSVNYSKIWKDMLAVVKAGVKNGEYPPLYCLASDYNKMKYLTEWMWMHGFSGDAQLSKNPLEKVYSIEDLVVALLEFSGSEKIAKSQVTSRLDGTQWEYIPTTACQFHKEKDVSRHCALAAVRRMAYTISDMVGSYYNISMSERHVPIKEDNPGVARVLPSDAVQLYSRRQYGEESQRKPAASFGPCAGDSSYSKLAQAEAGYRCRAGATGRDEEEEEEEFGGGGNMDESGLHAGHVKRAPSNLLRGGEFGWRYSQAPAPPPGPASGQFDDSDWPELGGACSKKQQEEVDTDDDIPFLPMSKLTLAGASTTWMATAGRGVAMNANKAPGAEQLLVEEIAGVGRDDCLSHILSTAGGEAQSVGRRLPQELGKRTSPLSAGRGSLPPGIERGSLPLGVGRGALPLGVGRGSLPLGVGRGALPPGVGRGTLPPGVGRGALPPGVGRGTFAQGIVRGDML